MLETMNGSSYEQLSLTCNTTTAVMQTSKEVSKSMWYSAPLVSPPLFTIWLRGMKVSARHSACVIFNRTCVSNYDQELTHVSAVR